MLPVEGYEPGEMEQRFKEIVKLKACHVNNKKMVEIKHIIYQPFQAEIVQLRWILEFGL